MQDLHNLLTKMQNEIAHTGNCSPDDVSQATTMLSNPDIDLDFSHDGASIKQMILGQNWFRLPYPHGDGNRKNIGVYMPPIEALLSHPLIIKNTSEIDRTVRSMSFENYESRARYIICGLAIPILGVPVLSPGVAIILLAGIDVARGLQAKNAGYNYLSTYHNPYAITNKTALRLKAAFANLTSKTSQPTSLDELLKVTKPTKEQKLTALALINKIENLDLRHEVLKKVTGNGVNGENDAWYKFFSYQRWFTAASVEKGTLKLAHEALAKTAEEIKATSAKKEKSTTATLMDQFKEKDMLVQAQQAEMPPVYQEPRRPTVIDKVSSFINNLFKRMPDAPRSEPLAYPSVPDHEPEAEPCLNRHASFGCSR